VNKFYLSVPELDATTSHGDLHAVLAALRTRQSCSIIEYRKRLANFWVHLKVLVRSRLDDPLWVERASRLWYDYRAIE